MIRKNEFKWIDLLVGIVFILISIYTFTNPGHCFGYYAAVQPVCLCGLHGIYCRFLSAFCRHREYHIRIFILRK